MHDYRFPWGDKMGCKLDVLHTPQVLSEVRGALEAWKLGIGERTVSDTDASSLPCRQRANHIPYFLPFLAAS